MKLHRPNQNTPPVCFTFAAQRAAADAAWIAHKSGTLSKKARYRQCQTLLLCSDVFGHLDPDSRNGAQWLVFWAYFGLYFQL